MRKFIALALFAVMLTTPLFSFSASGATADYSATINFAAGATGNASYDYLTIVPENSANPASITVKAWISNRTIHILESNVKNITLDAGKAMKEFGLTSGDVETYLKYIGQITVKIAGNGTNTYIIQNVPRVEGLLKDGSPFTGWSYKDGTLTFTSEMSSHTIVIDFYSTYEDLTAWVYSVLVLVIVLAVIGLVVRMLENYMKEFGPL